MDRVSKIFTGFQRTKLGPKLDAYRAKVPSAPRVLVSPWSRGPRRRRARRLVCVSLQTTVRGAWSCYTDAVPCLDALARLEKPPRLTVLTNGDPDQQQAKLARFGLLERFEAVLTPTQLGTAKPDPATFTASCAHLGVDPQSVISVGDWLEGDVIAATKAGLCAAWIDRGVEPFNGDQPHLARTVAADLALHRLENLGELTDLVGGRST
jgi:FMN phosphatase YigB (HAD superfamily)